MTPSTTPATRVRLVVCGNPDRGDDGVALAATAGLLAGLPASVRRALDVRRRPELRVEDVLDLNPDEGCVILDAVSGVTPGRVVVLPIERLAEGLPFSPRSSHELPIGLVIGLATALRERPLDGAFVGLGGAAWGHGEPLSRAARDALPAYRAAIAAALARLVDPATTRVGG
jgi:hydrogenase maturation protease